MVVLHTIRCAFYMVQGATACRPLVSFFAPSVTRVYVGLRSTDIFMHVNNAKYLEYFEFARWQHGIRASVMSRFWQTRMYPVIGAAHVQYVRELKPFQMAAVYTRVIGAHKKGLLMEQRLVSYNPKKKEEVLHAVFYFSQTFVKAGKPVEIIDALHAYGHDPEEFKRTYPWILNDGKPAWDDPAAPKFPSSMAFCNEADDAWRVALKAERDRQKQDAAATAAPSPTDGVNRGPRS
jgi:thioesterase-3